MKKNSLRSFERLKHQKLIDKVFSKDALSVHGDTILARFIPFNMTTEIPLLAGFSVSKRHYKKAHDRNLIRRWMKESYRTRKEIIHSIPNSQQVGWAVFFIFSKKQIAPTYSEIDQSIEKALYLIKKKIIKYHVDNTEHPVPVAD